MSLAEFNERPLYPASDSYAPGSSLGGDSGDNAEMSTRPTRREDEFLALLTRHRYALFNLIFCVVRSLPDSEDVFQQTAMALWADFDKFEPGTDFLAWAYQVARYRAWNFARSKRRERVFFSDDFVKELADSPFNPIDVQEARLLALAQCRGKLSTQDQQLLSLCYGGDSIREAAERMGRPLRSVYGSLSRIRRALYECIERTLAREART